MAPPASRRREVILEGLGASRGKAIGPATIILNIQQLNKVKEGDVIVTRMTTPDMVLVMRKAVGIVTDVGGMCCHAAIVSRELGIPCVVGTGNATKVLKDGMLIEVDGNAGVIYRYEENERINMLNKTSSTEFRIFGHKAKAIILKMNRGKPLCLENWDFEWPPIDVNQDYEWIAPRPEITGDPIGSLTVSGIEKIPYILGFSEIGPLYVRYYNATQYLRLDKIKMVMTALKEQIISRNNIFINKYKDGLYNSYKKFDEITNEIQKKKSSFTTMDSRDLLNLFKKWWKIEDEFFAHTYLIQAIGDDIVWPKVREILTEYFERDKADEYFAILSLPTKKTISIEFFEDCVTFINKFKTIKPLIFTNLSEKETIEIIKNMKDGKKWLKELENLTKKWGWVRSRLFYHEPISDIEKMLRYIKKYFPKDITIPNVNKNAREYEDCIKKLSSTMPPKKLDELLFYVDLGKFLSEERNNHYYLFMRNTEVIRDLFLELGKRLKEQGLLHDERDIFFLFIQEVFELFNPEIPVSDKQKIVSEIPNRMNAFTYVSKIKLHDRPGYNPNATPIRDDKYY